MNHVIETLARLVLSLAIVVAPTAAMLVTPSAAQAASGVEGKWHTPNDEGTVEIAINNETLTGKLVASDNSKAPLGTQILRGFKLQGDVWVGKIYSPKHGRTADAKLRLKGGELVITVQAGFRTKTVIWTRA